MFSQENRVIMSVRKIRDFLNTNLTLHKPEMNCTSEDLESKGTTSKKGSQHIQLRPRVMVDNQELMGKSQKSNSPATKVGL